MSKSEIEIEIIKLEDKGNKSIKEWLQLQKLYYIMSQYENEIDSN